MIVSVKYCLCQNCQNKEVPAISFDISAHKIFVKNFAAASIRIANFGNPVMVGRPRFSGLNVFEQPTALPQARISLTRQQILFA
jgi:hypothetical protein